MVNFCILVFGLLFSAYICNMFGYRSVVMGGSVSILFGIAGLIFTLIVGPYV